MDYPLLCSLTPQQAAGTGGASRQGAQSCLVLSLPGSSAKRHKASMRVQTFSGLIFLPGCVSCARFLNQAAQSQNRYESASGREAGIVRVGARKPIRGHTKIYGR